MCSGESHYVRSVLKDQFCLGNKPKSKKYPLNRLEVSNYVQRKDMFITKKKVLFTIRVEYPSVAEIRQYRICILVTLRGQAESLA
ncbi:hypothetical protein GDO78_016901 [Eleutherodactylus coqui]|uniref:Uncharacterized protein n=1 Tax=Eleutherodactylus coqui TaxID=57060 RepID=A0A8J6K0H6_ELECQ|nr:hypothetical protein GDO78_016901 [Eleutherodactylus coqui]